MIFLNTFYSKFEPSATLALSYNSNFLNHKMAERRKDMSSSTFKPSSESLSNELERLRLKAAVQYKDLKASYKELHRKRVSLLHFNLFISFHHIIIFKVVYLNTLESMDPALLSSNDRVDIRNLRMEVEKVRHFREQQRVRRLERRQQRDLGEVVDESSSSSSDSSDEIRQVNHHREREEVRAHHDDSPDSADEEVRLILQDK